MSGPSTARPAICLNMIVRNEAHIVHEVLDSVAPYVTSWVIVDTGSHDGTQNVIRQHMAGLGIGGELHERLWRDFGHNRSEALTLAQGRGDYIWVIDADDILVGAPDFSGLDADGYWLRYGGDFSYWRMQLFRDGQPWRYQGVVHEYPAYDGPHSEGRLEGDYYVNSRRLGARSRDSQTYARDRDLLMAEVERNPGDARSVFYLAQSCFDAGDFDGARKWYAQRATMGGWSEEVFVAMFRKAASMGQLGAPWPDVQDAYLRAWGFRPSRAEPLHAIAVHYRVDERYTLGYLFAERAATIPFPDADELFIRADVYAFRALDEQAVCASRLGMHSEALRLFRRLLARRDIPDDDRRRIAVNRDFSVPTALESASAYPDVARRLLPGPPASDVTVSLVAGPDRDLTEQTLNSFLHCCADLPRVGRFLVLDAGLSAEDRAALLDRYRFLEFVGSDPADTLGTHLAQISREIDGHYWLHLGQGWRFFAPESLIARLTAVLEAEPEVIQVGVNFADAAKLTGLCAEEGVVRRADGTGRYLLTDAVATGPAMFDTARLDSAGGFDDADSDPTVELGRRAANAGLRTASLDEVLCIAAV